MKRLIDAEHLKARIAKKRPIPESENPDDISDSYFIELTDYMMAEYVSSVVENEPTVTNAREVVFCEECKYWNRDYYKEGWCMCEKHSYEGYKGMRCFSRFTPSNAYCSFGERIKR